MTELNNNGHGNYYRHFYAFSLGLQALLQLCLMVSLHLILLPHMLAQTLALPYPQNSCHSCPNTPKTLLHACIAAKKIKATSESVICSVCRRCSVQKKLLILVTTKLDLLYLPLFVTYHLCILNKSGI